MFDATMLLALSSVCNAFSVFSFMLCQLILSATGNAIERAVRVAQDLKVL